MASRTQGRHTGVFASGRSRVLGYHRGGMGAGARADVPTAVMAASRELPAVPGLPWTLCFIRRGGQLLMLERRREPNRGLWSGVGGKLDAGESPRAGVHREVLEETGL